MNFTKLFRGARPSQDHVQCWRSKRAGAPVAKPETRPQARLVDESEPRGAVAITAPDGTELARMSRKAWDELSKEKP
jgi:hypothetical protein